MIGCHEARELIGGYVLCALDDDEAARVRTHLAACPRCAEEHARLAGLPDLLALAAPADPVPEPPPPALEQAVVETVARARPGARSRRKGGLLGGRRGAGARAAALAGAVAGAVAVAVAVGALALAGALGGSGEREVRLAATPEAAGASARAVIRERPHGMEVRLRAEGLAPTRDGVYELWFGGGDGRVSAGTFRVGRDGRADVRLYGAAEPGRQDRLGVTHEPDALDPAGNGPPVLVGRLPR